MKRKKSASGRSRASHALESVDSLQTFIKLMPPSRHDLPYAATPTTVYAGQSAGSLWAPASGSGNRLWPAQPAKKKQSASVCCSSCSFRYSTGRVYPSPVVGSRHSAATAVGRQPQPQAAGTRQRRFVKFLVFFRRFFAEVLRKFLAPLETSRPFSLPLFFSLTSVWCQNARQTSDKHIINDSARTSQNTSFVQSQCRHIPTAKHWCSRCNHCCQISLKNFASELVVP